LICEGLGAFEFGIVAEVFGLPRTTAKVVETTVAERERNTGLGVEWYDFKICSADRGPLRATGGLIVEAPQRSDSRECDALALKRCWAGRSEVEQDVISALVQQGAGRSAAVKATADAVLQSPQEFEPLFRTAVGLLHLRRRVADCL